MAGVFHSHKQIATKVLHATLKEVLPRSETELPVVL